MSKSKCHCDECLYGDGIFDYIKNVISPNKSVESENMIKKYIVLEDFITYKI